MLNKTKEVTSMFAERSIIRSERLANRGRHHFYESLTLKKSEIPAADENKTDQSIQVLVYCSISAYDPLFIKSISQLKIS